MAFALDLGHDAVSTFSQESPAAAGLTEEGRAMCLGIPGRVVALPADKPDIGRVDVEGVVRDVNFAFLADDPPATGDWVLIHLGFALERMTEAEVEDARSILAVLETGS